MAQKYATVRDFERWEEMAVAMTDAALLYSIRDAMEAAKALESHDPIGAGRYRDEASTYRTEINRRKRGGRKAPSAPAKKTIVVLP